MPLGIAVIGLGTMGSNLVLNLLDRGYTVGIYNRTAQKTTSFINALDEKHKQSATGFYDLKNLVQALKKPRIVLLMITSGYPVDATLDAIRECLEPDDAVLDGGNAAFSDTERRCRESEGKHLFVGCGISGGEAGARYGPSIMPGGMPAAWNVVGELLKNISAVHNGHQCCEWIGPGGSGHFVKSVHNGIEYAEIQLISEVYQILRNHCSNEQIADVLQEWRRRGTDGFLIEAAESVLRGKTAGNYVLEDVLDVAEQKGTGSWTAQEALSVQVAAPIITSAVIARFATQGKKERAYLAETLGQNLQSEKNADGDFRMHIQEHLRSAFVLAKALAFIEGCKIIEKVSEKHAWGINLETLCRIWRSGCIIQSGFLEELAEMVKTRPLEHSEKFQEICRGSEIGLKQVAEHIVQSGKCCPSFSAAFSHYVSIQTPKTSANMVQCLRDYFGKHGVQTEQDHGLG